MSWTIATCIEDGHPIIVKIDETYRDPGERRDLRTRISIRFLGNQMLQSEEGRAAFETLTLEPFLAASDGVEVATIAQWQPASYTYHTYCALGADPGSMSMDETLRKISSIAIEDDPEWRAYQSWLPDRPTFLRKLAGWFQIIQYVIANKLKRR